MKVLVLISALLVGIFSTNAQISINERIRFKDTVKVKKYKPEENGFSSLKLRMNPGESTVLNPDELRKLTFRFYGFMVKTILSSPWRIMGNWFTTIKWESRKRL